MFAVWPLTVHLIAPRDTDPSLPVIPFSPPHLPQQPGYRGPTHTGLTPCELQTALLLSSFVLSFSSSILCPLGFWAGPSCDLFCHRCSPAAQQLASIIRLIGLGLADSWGFSLSMRKKQETSTLQFPSHFRAMATDSESPGQGQSLYMPC